jgi:hypothetical protein
MRLVAIILNILVLGIATPISMMCILDHPERKTHWVVIPIALFALINLIGLHHTGGNKRTANMKQPRDKQNSMF